jgi:hypothetical protein
MMLIRDRLGLLGEQLPSDELLREQSFLVARGVRPMCLIEWVNSDAVALTRLSTLLDRYREGGSLPFVIDHGDGSASYGYAAARWVVETYEWLMDSQVPQERRDCILGLLLGYSASEIDRFEATASVRHYAPVASCGSPGSASR